VGISAGAASKENEPFYYSGSWMFLVCDESSPFSLFSFFPLLPQPGGRARTQSLIDERVCLAAGLLATNPLARPATSSLTSSASLLVSPPSPDDKDGATRRLRRPSGVRPARPVKAVLPPAGRDPERDL